VEHEVSRNSEAGGGLHSSMHWTYQGNDASLHGEQRAVRGDIVMDDWLGKTRIVAMSPCGKHLHLNLIMEGGQHTHRVWNVSAGLVRVIESSLPKAPTVTPSAAVSPRIPFCFQMDEHPLKLAIRSSESSESVMFFFGLLNVEREAAVRYQQDQDEFVKLITQAVASATAPSNVVTVIAITRSVNLALTHTLNPTLNPTPTQLTTPSPSPSALPSPVPSLSLSPQQALASATAPSKVVTVIALTLALSPALALTRTFTLSGSPRTLALSPALALTRTFTLSGSPRTTDGPGGGT
jgi:hypothetical protein